MTYQTMVKVAVDSVQLCGSLDLQKPTWLRVDKMYYSNIVHEFMNLAVHLSNPLGFADLRRIAWDLIHSKPKLDGSRQHRIAAEPFKLSNGMFWLLRIREDQMSIWSDYFFRDRIVLDWVRSPADDCPVALVEPDVRDGLGLLLLGELIDSKRVVTLRFGMVPDELE